MKKDTFTIGFMLFALFFGAGNLIYPPLLGIQSGTAYWAAISGFIITGVGLPILAVTAISFVKNDARELADRVHPVFGLIFTSVVYLAVAPFFGIPRAATVAHEIGIEPFVDGNSPIVLFVFTAIFFLLVFIFSLNPSKMVDQIGKYLTPILLLAIAGLSIGSFFMLDTPIASPAEQYTSAPVFKGFMEGYLTMDAIAALAFGIIVVKAFKERGVTTRKTMITSTLKAGIIAGIGLIVVYTSLGWIGTKMAAYGEFTNGGEILSEATGIIFGNFGTILLGMIVILACFTTSIGLVVASGEFFAKLTNIPYKWIISVVTIISFIIANQGLNTIISYSVPVLEFIYPIAIVLILLTFMHRLFHGLEAVYRGAILFTVIVSLLDGLMAVGFDLDPVTAFMGNLPFYDYGLGWLVPAIIGGVIGFIVSKKKS